MESRKPTTFDEWYRSLPKRDQEFWVHPDYAAEMRDLEIRQHPLYQQAIANVLALPRYYHPSDLEYESFAGHMIRVSDIEALQGEAQSDAE